jgi:transposase
MEAGSNSFELHRRITALGHKALVLESAHIGRHAKIYADNDKIAASRIAKVYLVGQAPCVWIPDDQTVQRRQLLHAYQRAVVNNTQSTNALKGYLNQFAIRLGKRSATSEKTHQWILQQKQWTPLQQEILAGHLGEIKLAVGQRKSFTRAIAREMTSEPEMLKLMSILGIGVINAFALIAIIGDIKRFDSPKKLVSYLGLNPGQRDSGNGKRIKVGMGQRGRKDMRTLLIQGAQAVLRRGRDSALAQWGWKLFARKGQRNIAVAAVARKLAVQVWHLLSGNKIEMLEPSKTRHTKLQKLSVMLGKTLRSELKLPGTLKECVQHFDQLIKPPNPSLEN